ncbi:MAG: polymer-forming cytoskeletal protein, partial [Candidatus Acidiferrales bacterium]
MSWPFSKRDSVEVSSDWTGFLAQGVHLEGTLELPGTFRLDATVKGNIVSNHSLILGEGAHV